MKAKLVSCKKIFNKGFMVLIGLVLLFSFSVGCTRKNTPQTTETTATKTAFRTTLKASSAKRTTTTTTGTQAQADQSYDDTEQEDQTDNADSTEPVSIEEETIDLNGKTIRFLAVNSDPSQIPTPGVYENMTYTIFGQSLLDVEKKYNVKFVFSPSNPNGWPQMANYFAQDFLAGLNSWEFVWATSNFMMPAHAVNNLIRPIDGIVQNINDRKWKNHSVWGFYPEWGGKKWGIASDIVLPQYQTHYNKDIITREGLEDIQMLARESQWNWDKFMDYAIRTTRDFNGDGVIDQWGVYNMYSNQLFEALMLANGVQYLKMEGERVVNDLSSPQVLATLGLIYNMFNVQNVIYTNAKDNAYAKNQALLCFGPRAFWSNWIRAAGIANGYAPMPMGPSVNRYTNVKTSLSFVAIPSYNTDPDLEDMIYVVMDLMDRDDTWKNAGYNLDQMAHEALAPWSYSELEMEFNLNFFFGYDKQTLFDIDEPSYQIYSGIPQFNTILTNNLINPTIQGKGSPGSNLDITIPLVQTAIDAITNQN